MTTLNNIKKYKTGFNAQQAVIFSEKLYWISV